MAEPLRIIMPIHSFEPGGVERTALNLGKRWEALGHDVKVVLGRSWGPTKSSAPDLTYVTRAEPFSTAEWETLWMIWCLWRYLRKHRADVLFCPGNTYTIVCVAMKLLLGSRCPPVVAKMSNDLDRKDMGGLERKLYHAWLRIQGRMLDRLVGMAEPMRGEIAEVMQVPSERIAIVRDPSLTREQFARLSAIEREGPGDGPIHVVSVGRLWTQKNYGLLIRAFAAQARPGDRMTIAGEGPERAKLESLIAELDMGHAISLPGHVQDPAALLQTADVFALSSDYEGVPAVIIEALAAGLPVVTTDCSRSISGLVAHGETGLLVPTGDEDGLKQALDAARRIPISPQQSRKIAALFTVDQAASDYLDVMDELLGSAAEREDAALSGTKS